MKRTILALLGITAAVTLAMFVPADAQTPAPAELFKRAVLQRADLSAPGREGVMAMGEFQPTGSTGRHTHPGEEITYVLAGPLVLEEEGKPNRILQTGDAFLIPAGKIHNAINQGTGVAKVVVTYVVEKGKPLTTPVK
jgi:quercetin dioxygenase-like cupin family protein